MKRRVKLFRGELGKQWKKYEPNSGRDPKGETQTKSACQISTNDDNQTASRSPKNGEAIGGQEEEDRVLGCLHPSNEMIEVLSCALCHQLLSECNRQ